MIWEKAAKFAFCFSFQAWINVRTLKETHTWSYCLLPYWRSVKITILKLLLVTDNYNTYLKLYCSQQVSIDSWPFKFEKIILRFPSSEWSYVSSNQRVMFSRDAFLSFCFRGGSSGGIIRAIIWGSVRSSVTLEHVRRKCRGFPAVEHICQGHPTSICGKYLFGRRFEI